MILSGVSELAEQDSDEQELDEQKLDGRHLIGQDQIGQNLTPYSKAGLAVLLTDSLNDLMTYLKIDLKR